MDISKYLVNEYTFERMQSYGDYECPSFKDFMAWNLKCISELNEEDRLWIMGLCKRISKRTIFLMDEEYASVNDATNIYFDNNKNVCIVNPR